MLSSDVFSGIFIFIYPSSLGIGGLCSANHHLGTMQDSHPPVAGRTLSSSPLYGRESIPCTPCGNILVLVKGCDGQGGIADSCTAVRLVQLH